MKTVYTVYNKYDGFVNLETEFEQLAYDVFEDMNRPFEHISPLERPWGVSSRIMSDAYEVK